MGRFPTPRRREKVVPVDPEAPREEPHPLTDRERVDVLLDEYSRLRMGLGALFYRVNGRLAKLGELDLWLAQQVVVVKDRGLK